MAFHWLKEGMALQSRHKITPHGTSPLRINRAFRQAGFDQELLMPFERACRNMRLFAGLAGALILLIASTTAWGAAVEPPLVFGIPVDFVLFALTLAGVALFHRHTLAI